MINYLLRYFIFCCFSIISFSAQSEWNLSTLCESMAKQKAIVVNYQEEKHLSVLDDASLSSGQLVYQFPNLLEKRVDHPLKQVMTFDRKQLSLKENEKSYCIDVSDAPELSAYLESILDLLSGKQTQLLSSFDISLTGDRNGWILTMVAKKEEVRRLINNVIVKGHDHLIQEITIHQTDGDWSVMSLK